MLQERHSRHRAVAALRRLVAATLAGRSRSGSVVPWPRLVLRDSAWAELLTLLGTDPTATEARPGLMLGPPRANRKPVFRVFDAAGDTVAFAKLGVNQLTDELVTQEVAALHAVAELRLRGIDAPPVLYEGAWRDHRLLLTGALVGPGPRQARDLPASATQELSQQCARDMPLASLDLMAASTGFDRGVLDRAQASLRASHGDVLVSTGASHGDWSPWNMARVSGKLQVWDWERFAVGVPRGFDAIHFAAGSVRVGPGGVDGERRFRSTVPGVLEATGVDPRQAQLLLVCYLLRIGLRYREDVSRESSPGVHRRLAWVEDSLHRELGNLER